MKKIVASITLLLIAFIGCSEDKASKTDSSKDDLGASSDKLPKDGDNCDMYTFTPFCSRDHKAINCDAFDGFKIESCSENEECLIGVTTGFFTKKPDAGCYRPCSIEDIDKEISICKNGRNKYYKCGEFNGKYYYFYESYINCDHGCNNNGSDCIKISEKEYALCDPKDPETRNICDHNILLDCNYCRGLGCDDIIYGAVDCEDDGKICARGRCVKKNVSNEYTDCGEDYKKHCEGAYEVMCGFNNYVISIGCEEGRTCVEIDDELACLEPCLEKT